MADTYIDRGYVTESDIDFKYEPLQGHYDLTARGQWALIDFEGKVPSEAKRVKLGMLINAPNAGTVIEISQYGMPGFNVGWARTPEPGNTGQSNEEICFSQTNKKLYYFVSNRPVNFIFVYVLGWWV